MDRRSFFRTVLGGAVAACIPTPARIVVDWDGLSQVERSARKNALFAYVYGFRQCGKTEVTMNFVRQQLQAGKLKHFWVTNYEATPHPWASKHLEG